MVLSTARVEEKLKSLDRLLQQTLVGQVPERVPRLPGRDVEVLDPAELPAKLGFSHPLGQARLLHDLASIELQAMELGVRTLLEFPDAPSDFRAELADVTRAEGAHLALCLAALRDQDVEWGRWPVHVALWSAVSADDTLLDRILIVHRHLEGSGLDSGESILRRLTGASARSAKPVVEQIVREEIDHVAFGSRWFRLICRELRLDPDEEFRRRMPAIIASAPRRERLSMDLRRLAGFTAAELELLADIQTPQHHRERGHQGARRD